MRRLWPVMLPSALAGCLGEGYLHMQLCEAWEERRRQGVLQWPSDDLPPPGDGGSLQLLAGELGMVAQLAPNRGQKRALGAQALTSNSTHLDFDKGRFHFGKVPEEEVLFCFSPRRQSSCHHTETSNTCHWPQYAATDADANETCAGAEKAKVIVNKHPVCRNHFLLVPGDEEQPQVLTRAALQLGLAFAFRGSERLWLSFNTIGAGASVNHLHLQGFFPEAGLHFPLENVRERVRPAALSRGPVALGRLSGWPLCTWVFTWTDEAVLGIDTSLAERRLAEFAHAFVETLQVLDIAHNVLINMARRQVFIFPRRTFFEQSSDVTNLQVSGHEVLGWWIVAKEEHDLDEAKAFQMLRAAQLPTSTQQKVLKALEWIGWSLNEEAKIPCETALTQ